MTFQEVLDREAVLAQQYHIYLGPDDELFDFFHLSTMANKQVQEKIDAAKNNKIWVL